MGTRDRYESISSGEKESGVPVTGASQFVEGKKGSGVPVTDASTF